MYLKRFFLKSFLFLFLYACQSNTPVQASHPIVDETETEPDSEQLPIQTGAEQLDKIKKIVDNRRVGIVGNQTTIVGEEHLVDVLLRKGVNVVKVFSPEHGFRGDADAGAKVNSEIDEKTGLPIVSLYGSNNKPTAAQLKGVDVLLFDLQDVGVRFYTYISTLHYVMEAAGENNIDVVVLDRPNPNGGIVDGPMRKAGFESFIGVDPLPLLHGMTIGEIARMINGEKWLKNDVQCQLQVVPCQNYERTMPYSLPVNPSPNLRSDEAIQLYPSLCLFEGTILSVGRGTEIPFEIFGHPDLKGVEGYDYEFMPISSFGAQKPKLENQVCYGKNLHDEVTGKQLHRLELKWLIEAYQIMKSKSDKFFRNQTFDILAGSDELRKQIIAGKSEEEIRDSWKSDLEKFKTERENYLLY